VKETFVARMKQEESESNAYRGVREILLWNLGRKVQIAAVQKLDKSWVELMKDTWRKRGKVLRRWLESIIWRETWFDTSRRYIAVFGRL